MPLRHVIIKEKAMPKTVVVQFSIKLSHQEALRQKAAKALDTESSYLRKLLTRAL